MVPQVNIIILNWNDYQSTLLCIESLGLLNYSNYQIMVFDNGSSNESVQVLSKIKNIKLYCNASNLGFAGGNNYAMKKALESGADYVWLLNNDATVAPDCLEKLVNVSEADKNIGLVSPVIYDAEICNKIQHCGTRFDLSIPLLEEANNIETALRWQNEYAQGIVLWGTGLLISRRTIELIGMFDERLFAYAEDTDLSMRSVKAGLKNITVFEASIWHQSHKGNRKPHYYYYVVRNSFRFWKKHLTLKTYLKVFWWNIDQTRSRITKLKDHPDLIQACLLGLWDGLRGEIGEYPPHRRAPWFIRSWFG
ncbi:MAG: glycosyltransferase family 2 protein [Methylovulum sp.]|nr:glycosyltransferase family 2 protein [Methylovulum sp.]